MYYVIAIDKNIECIKYEVNNFSASDHYPVTALIKIHLDTNPIPVLKRSFKRIDYDLLQSKVAAISLPDPQEHDTNNLVNSWHSSFINILDEAAPIKNIPRKKHSIPWISPATKKIISDRNTLAKHLTSSSTQNKPDHHNMLKVLKRRIKSRIRRESKEHGKQILQENDRKEVWKFIRNTRFSVTKGQSNLIDPPHIKRSPSQNSE